MTIFVLQNRKSLCYVGMRLLCSKNEHYAFKKMPIIPKIMPLILANNVSYSCTRPFITDVLASNSIDFLLFQSIKAF